MFQLNTGRVRWNHEQGKIRRAFRASSENQKERCNVTEQYCRLGPVEHSAVLKAVRGGVNVVQVVTQLGFVDGG